MLNAARFTLFALVSLLLAASSSAVEPLKTDKSSDGPIAYRVLATSRTSTLEKEMNEAAEDGFEFDDMMGGETLGGDEVVTVMVRREGVGSEQRYEYKLLATSKTSTMLKELNQAGSEGFVYRGQSVAETAFGGNEVISLLSRALDQQRKRYVYLLKATKRTKTMDKELNHAGQEGFELMGLTVSTTAFGGQELVSILMRAE